MASMAMFYDQFESGHSNMADFKPEVHISQYEDEIGTPFQWLCLCLRSPAAEVENSKWRSKCRKYLSL